ncbi:hypothetical protein DPM19_29355 [Actinomadura craniellae]|uniref:Uncharacterized protein n=1 Tax=Actinomadura craniellae TaxID=2231787 RepID=A0A365GY10_9ACTN|nr:hypothetical protein [Actinomadura craniellae]RAY11720.1 hypothetical protein DPM19_29355 [Actinomadura craniellae]
MATVTFLDETVSGERRDGLALAGLPDALTARELIRLRVREEVARHNAAPYGRFAGLVQPEEPQPGWLRRLDWERQADIAERAFLRNGFFMLAGDRQIEELDELVDLTGDPELVFIKLVPLVGG